MPRRLRNAHWLALVLVLLPPARLWATPPPPINFIPADSQVFSDLRAATDCNERGIAHSDRHEIDQAIADYNKMIELCHVAKNRGADGQFEPGGNPIEHTLADTVLQVGYQNRAAVWCVKDGFDNAIADCDQSLRIDSTTVLSLPAYINRGCAWFGKGNLDRAMADFNRVLEQIPRDATVHYNRGGVWAAKRDYAQSVADDNAAIHSDAAFPLPYAARAEIWATAADPSVRNGKAALDSALRARALIESKTPVAGDDEPAYVLTALASAYAETGDFYLAVRYQKSALALWVEDDYRENARRRLKLYEAKTPYRDSEVGDVIVRPVCSVETHFDKRSFQSGAGEGVTTGGPPDPIVIGPEPGPEPAETPAETAGKADEPAPSSPRALHLLAIADRFRRRGHRDSARRAYQRVIEDYPDFAEAATAESRLRSLLNRNRRRR